MQIYIHRNNEDFGPYSRETALEYVKLGVFQACDHACYSGMSEWKTLSELLGIAAAAEPKKGSKSTGCVLPRPSSQIRTTALMSPQPARAPSRVSGPAGEKKRGRMIALNLLLILIVAAGGYLRLGGGAEKGRRVLAAVSASISSQTDAPAAASPAPVPVVSAPVVVQKEPVATAPAVAPPPVVASRPAPPKPFDPADLAGNPGAWPKTLRLKQAVRFPAVFNSQIVGSVIVPPGTEATLVKIEGDQLTLNYQGGTQRISWKLTDLEDAAAKIPPVAPAATPATETTVTAGDASPAGN